MLLSTWLDLLLVLRLLNWIYINFDHVSFNKQSLCQQLGATSDQEFHQLLTLFDTMQEQAIMRAKDNNNSSWMSVLPLARSQFDLSAQESRDGLTLCYKKHCYLYLLYGMVVEHHLVLSMPLIVVWRLGDY